jgi:RNA polymerase primary sigma factor
MAERIMTGEIKAQSITAHDYSPNHPTAESQQFAQAVEVLRNAREGVAGGSGKAIRSAVGAIEALELRIEFLRDVACVMGETPELKKLAIELANNLEDFDEGSEALLIAFLPLCRRYAAQQATDDEDQEDVFQAGFFGLKRAVVRFRPELAKHFIVYASFWLRQAVVRLRQDEGRLVRVPAHRHEALVKWQRAAEFLEARCLRSPTFDEMAAELGWSPDDVQRLARIPHEAVDFDSLAEEADSEGESEVPDGVRVADIIRLINDELDQLPDRVADVLRRRYGIGFEDEMTLEEVGQIYGVTRERIRQIEAKGFRRLMHPARMRYLSQAL